MVAVDIWVEGIADQKFLADVLKTWYNLSFDKNFKCRDESRKIALQIRKGDGVSNFNSEEGWGKIQPSFEENNAIGTKNLIIADADEDFLARKKEIEKTVKAVDFNVESDLFLWPNHQAHAEKGDLERLLEQIIHPDNKAIFECWRAYEECLNNAPGKTYTTPARKTKIYAYLEALLGETKSEKDKIKERERDYANVDHWQLDNTKEPLKSLHEFLKQHLGL
ncbi:MAG: hypothetical protein KA165_06225 [Saprospiraceae bacterium]|nr:hypothetical protein [Saprospiraceae bacterium]